MRISAVVAVRPQKNVVPSVEEYIVRKNTFVGQDAGM
jgi:hypothetical protein